MQIKVVFNWVINSIRFDYKRISYIYVIIIIIVIIIITILILILI